MRASGKLCCSVLYSFSPQVFSKICFSSLSACLHWKHGEITEILVLSWGWQLVLFTSLTIVKIKYKNLWWLISLWFDQMRVVWIKDFLNNTGEECGYAWGEEPGRVWALVNPYRGIGVFQIPGTDIHGFNKKKKNPLEITLVFICVQECWAPALHTNILSLSEKMNIGRKWQVVTEVL